MQKSENEIKKEYLGNYRNLTRQITRLENQIKELRWDKMCPIVTYDDMPKGSNQSDLSDYVARLDELQTECIKLRKEKLEVCQEIRGKIESMENEVEKDVLQYRYIEMLKWEAICIAIGYSWKQTHRIHARALSNFKMT